MATTPCPTILVYLVLTTCLLHVVTCLYNTTEAGKIEDAILRNYHTTIRPSESVQVSLDVGLYHISSLSNIDQELSLVGFLILLWQDDRLIWTPSSYGNISSTHVKSSQIWVPPVTLANSTSSGDQEFCSSSYITGIVLYQFKADGIRLLSDDSDTERIPLYVDATGFVVWLAAANYLVKCNVDITFYPFDSQTCSMKVSTWMYGINEVNLTNMSDIVNLELYEENGEWDLTSSSVSLGERSLHGHGMSMAEFSLKLRRKHSYYILNMILPVVFTSILGCLVFLLPIESGEKNGFALTILLSLSVIMTIVSDKIPPTSTHVCILSVYLLCALSVSVTEVLVTVFIQRVHSKTYDTGSNNTKLQSFASFLAKLAMYTNKKDEPETTDDNFSTPNSRRNTKIFPKDIPQRSFMKHDILEHRLGDDVDKSGKTTEDKKVDSTNIEAIYNYKDISVCLDKICFYIFFLFTVVLTVVFLLVIANGEED